jgi:hypothetical protein
MAAFLRRGSALVAIALVLAACTGRAAFAREGFYLGYAFLGQTAKGDLDGKTSALDSAGNQYLVGSLNSGVGSGFLVGYGLNKYFGLELLAGASTHTATFQGQPDTDAVLAWSTLGVRITAPIAKSFEAFFRYGEGAYGVHYSKYVLLAPGLTQTTDVQYSGAGSAYGVGFEILGDHLGVEFSTMMHTATLTKAKASGVANEFSLPRHLQVPIVTNAVAFNYHF